MDFEHNPTSETKSQVELMLNANLDMMGSTKIDNHQKLDSCPEEERWSQLPTLLVWMIKDRLNTADSSRLAFVCKNWEAASLSYSPKHRQQCVVPWLMHRRATTTWEFVNFSTMEKLALELPQVGKKSQFLFSRRGWLLFRLTKSFSMYHAIVLFNPLTNAKISMPDPGKQVPATLASFSALDDDTPQWVVFSACTPAFRIFYIAGINDKKWTKHTYGDGRRMDYTASLVVRGHKVYCLDMLGGLFIFDMANLVWKEVAATGLLSHNSQWWMMESDEGEIVQIDRGRDLKTFTFFKLNDSQNGWEELTHMYLEDKSWFLNCDNNHFMTSGGTKKVYQLDMYREEVYEEFRARKQVIHIRDLNSRAKQSYKIHPDDIGGLWVDLGWMDRVPPSCVLWQSHNLSFVPRVY